MKAARIYGPSDIRYEEVPTPSPGPGEVLVQVSAEGVCGSDLMLLSGDFPYIKDGLTTYPFTPGHEFSGKVAELDPGVKGFSIGEPVVGEPSLGCGQCRWCLGGRYDLCPQRQEVGSLRNKAGGYAEYVVMPARHLYKAPPSVSLEEAALTEPAADAVYALQKSKISGASLVVILGDGTMGLLSLQTAKAFGATRVLLTGLSDFKLSIGLKLGADEIINIKRDDLRDRVKELSQGVGADVVVEASGSPDAIAQAVHLVKAGGEIVVIGIFGAKPVPFDMTTLVLKDAALIGSHVSPNRFIPTLNLLAAGKIKTGPLITHRFPLSAVHEALRAQVELEQERIKIIVLT